jgi:hypothetical protein
MWTKVNVWVTHGEFFAGWFSLDGHEADEHEAGKLLASGTHVSLEPGNKDSMLLKTTRCTDTIACSTWYAWLASALKGRAPCDQKQCGGLRCGVAVHATLLQP